MTTKTERDALLRAVELMLYYSSADYVPNMAFAQLRQARNAAVATPEAAKDGDSERSALAWMQRTAEALGVASRDDGLLCVAGALTGWIDKHRIAPQDGGAVDSPIDAADNVEYVRHCADKLEAFGLRVTAGALRVIAEDYAALAHTRQTATAADEAVDYVAIANRTQAITGRSVWPSTVKAILEAARPAPTSSTSDSIARTLQQEPQS